MLDINRQDTLFPLHNTVKPLDTFEEDQRYHYNSNCIEPIKQILKTYKVDVIGKQIIITDGCFYEYDEYEDTYTLLRHLGDHWEGVDCNYDNTVIDHDSIVCWRARPKTRDKVKNIKAFRQ